MKDFYDDELEKKLIFKYDKWRIEVQKAEQAVVRGTGRIILQMKECRRAANILRHRH